MRALVCTLLVATGCATGDVDLTGKSCPCATGWYCDTALRTCLPGIPPDSDGGATIDAGRDAAGPGDAAMPDARLPDAGVPDGGPGDTGESDAGPPDSGMPDDTRCDDLHAGAIFCDGFENPAPGFPAWTGSFVSEGMVSRDATQTHVGVGSLRAATTAGGAQATVRYLLPSTITSGDLYLRAFVYIPSSVAEAGSFAIVQAGIDVSPWYHVSLGASTVGSALLFIEAEGGADSATGRMMPRDEWVCLEAHVLIAETGGLAEMWMNGTLEGQVTGFDTSPMRGYERIVAGLPFTDSTRTTTAVYVDEVVLSRTRVGCD